MTTFADGEQAGENKGPGEFPRHADCLPRAERPGDYTPGRSPFCPACGQPYAEHLGLVGTCGLLQEAKAYAAALEELAAESIALLEEIRARIQGEDGQ